ncbi:MAG: cobalt-precorrin 5A hydrolase [Faecalibacterium sp.]
MTISWLAFTEKGFALAQRLAAQLGGSASRCGAEITLAGWTAQQFSKSDALVFVGAVGIAVRAVAPHCRSKASDPAVVAVDECARFAVPLLSGHLGGANDLARRIAAVCGAAAVITTATDVNGIFAVDEWARRQNCTVLEPERIKRISGALLAGRTVRIFSDWPISGRLPHGIESARNAAQADVCLSMTRCGEQALHLVPRIGVLGVGCRRGIPAQQLEAVFLDFCAESGLALQAVCAAASIDLKQNEPGLAAFCRQHDWPIRFYSAAQLAAVPGSFSPSSFVQSIAGVDNVCERAAVLRSGGTLLVPKFARNGVTFALAAKPYLPDWRWQDEC